MRKKYKIINQIKSKYVRELVKNFIEKHGMNEVEAIEILLFFGYKKIEELESNRVISVI